MDDCFGCECDGEFELFYLVVFEGVGIGYVG